MNSINSINQLNSKKYVVLTDNIPYDNDDYDLWGAILYDIENNSIFTTKYGHGVDMTERKDSFDLNEYLNMCDNNELAKKLIDILFKKFNIGYNNINIENFALKYNQHNPIAIKVKVVRGRKYKNETCYLVGGKKKYNPYKSHYSVVYDKKPILKLDNGELVEINSFDYLQIIEDNFEQTINNECRKSFVNNMDNALKLAWLLAYNMSYCYNDTLKKNYLIEDYSNKGLNIFIK